VALAWDYSAYKSLMLKASSFANNIPLLKSYLFGPLSSSASTRVCPRIPRAFVFASTRRSTGVRHHRHLYSNVSGRRTHFYFQDMSSMEERRWNQLAERMNVFHEHFKREFNEIYALADGSFNKKGMSLRLYLRKADELCEYLTLHHTIEERRIFPVLAKKMPEFRSNQAHIKSHQGIHKGLDALEALLKKWKADPKEYSPEDMKACLDSWREVLFVHLDEEVRDLSGENMKKYWTLQELERIPM